MKVIFGDMEFGEFSLENGVAPEAVCLIHKVKAVMEVPTVQVADALLGVYDSYIIPERGTYRIAYLPGALDNLFVGENK